MQASGWFTRHSQVRTWRVLRVQNDGRYVCYKRTHASFLTSAVSSGDDKPRRQRGCGRGRSDRIPDSKIANMTLEWVEEKDGSTDMSAESSCTKHCTHLVHVYRRRGPSACGTCGLAASLCKHRSTPDPSRSLASKSQVSPPLHAPAMRARAPHLLLPTTSLRSGLIGIFKGVILGPRPGR